MLRIAFHAFIILILTMLTQLGGLAWLATLFFRKRLIAFVFAYAGLSIAAICVAPMFGRTALSCFDDGPLEVQSWMYCALNRNYVSPELKQVLTDTADEVERRHPGTTTLVLDANFPFVTGFPLLPHLSHDDGEKVDLAFYYADGSGYLRGATRSPIGYFAFENGPTECTSNWPTLRWNLDFAQPLWSNFDIDEDRMRTILQVLTKDKRVAKVFVEPHLVDRLNAAHPKVRFQGCRAARHDDHIHIQL